MTKENKKKKFVTLISSIARERKQKADKSLAEHTFLLQQVQEKSSLFDYLLFRALMEQADNLSLVYGKPHQFQLLEVEQTRIGKETFEALDKAAILRPTRLGPLTLIG